jgi:hypothetical protein
VASTIQTSKSNALLSLSIGSSTQIYSPFTSVSLLSQVQQDHQFVAQFHQASRPPH